MREVEPTVFIVDDDESVSRALKRLLVSAGYRVEVFPSADAFLNNSGNRGNACLMLDVQMPGLNGLELQAKLTDAGIEIPIVFITGHGYIPMSRTRVVRLPCSFGNQYSDHPHYGA
ncbi:MAG TPA: response regulator [Blastocatellia bacterium]|nr:response regulator [Blastocatellia bacterium]